MKTAALLLVSAVSCSAFSMSSSKRVVTQTITSLNAEADSRRAFVAYSSAAALSLLSVVTSNPEEAFASGGATAGKYT